MKKKIKNRTQIYNPATQRWVKFNTKQGGIVQYKKSKKPFLNVKKYKKRKYDNKIPVDNI